MYVQSEKDYTTTIISAYRNFKIYTIMIYWLGRMTFFDKQG
jgi:hypothetical protein